jgi:endo-1,4-beta-xylanase
MKFTPASAALAASLLFSTAGAVPVAETSPTAPPYLNDLAELAGKLWFGTAADIPGTAETSDTAYMNILKDTNIFGEITPANMMKVYFVPV